MKLSLSFVEFDHKTGKVGTELHSVVSYGDEASLLLIARYLFDGENVVRYCRFFDDKKSEGDGELMPQPKLSVDVPF